MVPMPTMVPAPVPAPSAVSSEGMSRTFQPVAEPTPEKSKASFAAVKSGELVMTRSCFFKVVSVVHGFYSQGKSGRNQKIRKSQGENKSVRGKSWNLEVPGCKS